MQAHMYALKSWTIKKVDENGNILKGACFQLRQGNVVVEQGTYGGTHTGTFRGPDGSEIPPTGKAMNVSFAAIFHVKDDKITSIRLYYDQIELLTQLGLMPQPTA